MPIVDPFDTPSSGGIVDPFEIPGGQSPVTATGLAKALGTGVEKGVTGTIGLPAAAGDLLVSGATALGLDTKPGQALLDQTISGRIKKAITPTAEGLNKGLENLGLIHKPENKAEEYAQSVGEMLPMAPLGPGGALRKLGMAAASGIAGQGAEDLAPNELRPIARIAGTMLPGGIESAATRFRAPTPGQLGAEAKSGYRQADAQGLTFTDQEIMNTHRQAEDALFNAGARRVQGAHGDPIQQVYGALDELASKTSLRSPGTIGSSPRAADWQDMQHVMQRLNFIKDSNPGNPAVRNAVRIAKDELDSLMVGVTGNKAANANFRALKRDEDIANRVERALDRAGATGTGHNLGNVLRQEMGSLLRDRKFMSRATQDQINNIRAIVRGDFTDNTLRFLGKFAPSGSVSTGMFRLLTSELSKGPVSAATIPLALTTHGARALGEARIGRKIDRLRSSIRANSPLGQSMGAPASMARVDRDKAAAKLAAITRGVVAGETSEGYPYYRPIGSQ